MDVIARARAGDGDAFGELTEPYRRALHVHCYRMLGSFQDAEDALQETLLTAWRSLADFEGRASLRAWLYRIATTRCLNALRSASRRPAKAWDVPGVDPPQPTRLGDVPWLEPYPDALLAANVDAPLGPEARYEQTEAISLAFVTALQSLPARQRAVLILRDVLGYRAKEVALMLDATIESVNAALKRARAGLPLDAGGEPPPAPDSPVERALVERFVRAYGAGDIDALVALLTDDVRVSMPPIPLEYWGREAARRFYTALVPKRPYELEPIRANGQPALVSYLRGDDGSPQAVGVAVLSLRGERICAIARFERTVLAAFGPPHDAGGDAERHAQSRSE